MTSRVQTHRSSVTGQRPGNNTRTVGENFVNFADKAAGYIDPDGVARDYIAVRYFSTTANYAIGAHVINAGVLYRALVAITAGAFNPTQWTSGLAVADGDARYVKTADAETLYVNSAGDVMTGALTLSGNPSNALHASPKQYTDTKLPIAGGTMTGMLTLNSDPTNPNDASTKGYVDNQTGTRIARAGDTMSGPLVVVTPPVANNHAASKGYIDGLVGPLSSGKVDEAPNDGNQYARQSNAWTKVTGGALIGDTPPPTATPNSFWWNSANGVLAIKYDDGNSVQFVQVNGAQGLQPPPSDGNEYVMINGVWRIKHQTFSLSTVGLTWLVPDGARIMRYVAAITAGANPTNPAMRVSFDGIAFASGAADYATGGFQNATGSTGNQVATRGDAAQLALSGNMVNVSYTAHIEGHLTVGRSSNAFTFGGLTRSSIYGVATTYDYFQYIVRHTVGGVVSSAYTAIKAIQVFPSGGSFGAGSCIAVTWEY